MKGTRVWPNEDGFLDQKAMNMPGAYGRVDIPKALATMERRGYPITADHPWCDWEVCTPDGIVGRLAPHIHTVEEHADGTITVTPSIDMSRIVPGGYHGWLKKGEWS